MTTALAGLFSRHMRIGSSSGQLRTVAQSPAASSSSLRQAVRTMKTVRSPTGATWGGGKQKTHTGTGKRFAPITKGAGSHLGMVLPRDPASRQVFGAMVYEGSLPADFLIPQSASGITFKRGHTGMRHLNSKMSSKRRRTLRGTTAVTHPSHIKALRRLLGKRARN